MRNLFLKMGDSFAYAILIVAIAAIAIFIVAVLIVVLRWIVVPVLLLIGATTWLAIRNDIRNDPEKRNREFL